MTKRDSWRLQHEDVDVSYNTSMSGKSGKFARSTKVTSCTVTVLHRATGIKLQAKVPPGHYTKTEMQQRRRQVYLELFDDLEERVGKTLYGAGFKIDGR